MYKVWAGRTCQSRGARTDSAGSYPTQDPTLSLCDPEDSLPGGCQQQLLNVQNGHVLNVSLFNSVLYFLLDLSCISCGILSKSLSFFEFYFPEQHNHNRYPLHTILLQTQVTANTCVTRGRHRRGFLTSAWAAQGATFSPSQQPGANLKKLDTEKQFT